MSDHTKEKSMMEHPSRRSFLSISSVALATAAFAGLTANAQDKASTQKAEHDHSPNDPGPENKALLDENPNSNTPPPTDHGDLVAIWYTKYQFLANIGVDRDAEGPHRMKQDAENTSKPNPQRKLWTE
jgi:hypothetical protein